MHHGVSVRHSRWGGNNPISHGAPTRLSPEASPLRQFVRGRRPARWPILRLRSPLRTYRLGNPEAAAIPSPLRDLRLLSGTFSNAQPSCILPLPSPQSGPTVFPGHKRAASFLIHRPRLVCLALPSGWRLVDRNVRTQARTHGHTHRDYRALKSKGH